MSGGKVKASESETLCKLTESVSELWWLGRGTKKFSCASARGTAQPEVLQCGSGSDEKCTREFKLEDVSGTSALLPVSSVDS